MGAVYEAENTLSLKRSAIKWLHPRLLNVPDAAKRLIHEARATARVRHRNVVDIYDVVVVEDSSVFLVMELLEGVQLSAYLNEETRLVHEVITVLLPAMHGLAAAHSCGVVHRDVKPDNILLIRESGSTAWIPKVIDFGISRVFDEGERITRSGVTMGTPPYISFEQLRGARDVDQRADVFAVGVILYEAVVGRPPYDATSFGEQAISFVTTDPPAPKLVRSRVPDGLSNLIMTAIAKQREQRFASMLEFIAALEPYAQLDAYPEPLSARPPRPYSERTAEADLSGFGSQEAAASTATKVGEEPRPALRSGWRLAGDARWKRGLLTLTVLSVLAGALLIFQESSSRSAKHPPSQTGEPMSSRAHAAPEGAVRDSRVLQAPSVPALPSTSLPPGGGDAALEPPSRKRAERRPISYVRTARALPTPSTAVGLPSEAARSDSAQSGIEQELTRSDEQASSAASPSSDVEPKPDSPHRAGDMRRDEF